MLRELDGFDSISGYLTGFKGVLRSVSRDCPCGGCLIGHGRRTRWVVSPAGVFEVPIQQMKCKRCGTIISLLPRFLYAFYSCAKDLVARIGSLWERGLRSMSDVRHILVGACAALQCRLHLSSLYRWARLASL